MSNIRSLFLGYSVQDRFMALNLAWALNNVGISLIPVRLEAYTTELPKQLATQKLLILTSEGLLAGDLLKKIIKTTQQQQIDTSCLLINSAKTPPQFLATIKTFSLECRLPIVLDTVTELVEDLKNHFPSLKWKPVSAGKMYLNGLITQIALQAGLTDDLSQSIQRAVTVQPVLSDSIENWQAPARFTLHHAELKPEWESDQDFYSFPDVVKAIPRFVLTGKQSSGKTTAIQQVILEQAQNYGTKRKPNVISPFPLYVQLTHWDDSYEDNFEKFLASQIAHIPKARVMLHAGRAMLWLDVSAESEHAYQAIKAWIQANNLPPRMVIVMTEGKSGLFAPEDYGLPCVRINPLDANHVTQYATYYFGEDAPSLLETFIYDKIDSTGRRRIPSDLETLGLTLLYHTTQDDVSTIPNKATYIEAFVRRRWETYAGKYAKQVSYDSLLSLLNRLATMMLYDGWINGLPQSVAEQHFGEDAAYEVAYAYEAAHHIGLISTTINGVSFATNRLLYFFAGQALTANVLPKVLHIRRFTTHQTALSAWEHAVIYYLKMCSNEDFEDVVTIVIERNPFVALYTLERLVDYELPFRMLITAISHDNADIAENTLVQFQHIPLAIILPPLLQLARGDGWQTRLGAANLIAALAPQNFAGLLEVLNNENEIQSDVIAALRVLQDEIVPVLMRMLGNPHQRILSLRTLGAIGDKAATPLIVQLLNQHTSHATDVLSTITHCLIALSNIQDESALEFILPMLDHRREGVRVSAMACLVEYGETALPFLLQLTEHDSPTMRWLAISALNRFYDLVTSDIQLQALKDSDPDVRVKAIEGLHDVIEPKVISALLYSRSDTEMAHRATKTVADAAATALKALGVTNDEMNPRKLNDARVEKIVHRVMNANKENAARNSAAKAKARLTRLPRPDVDVPDFHEPLEENNTEPVTHLGLLEQLNDSSPERRMDAIRKLSSTVNATVIEGILGCVTDSNRLVSDLAVHILQYHGKHVVPFIRRYLTSDSLDEKLIGLEIAQGLADADLTQELITCLDVSDYHRTLRWHGRVSDLAAKCLLAINTEESRSAVLRWRKQKFIHYADKHHVEGKVQLPEAPAPPPSIDPDVPVAIVNYLQTFASLLSQIRLAAWDDKQIAAKALHAQAKALRHHAPTDVLELLFDTLKNDEDWVMQWAVAEALAWLADRKAVPALVAQVRNRHWNVRMTAITALIEIGDIAAIQFIEEALLDAHPQVREIAVEAIGILGGASNVPSLIRVIQQDTDDMVKLAAVIALGRIPSLESIPVLLNLIKTDSINLKWAAARSLSVVVTDAYIDDLVPYLKDTSRPDWDDVRVCDWVREALERLDTTRARQVLKQWRLSMN